MEKVTWFVLLERFCHDGPLTPLRMMCSGEDDAKKEYARIGSIAYGYQTIVAEKERVPNEAAS